MTNATIIKRFQRNSGTSYHVIREHDEMDITPYVHGGFTSVEAARQWAAINNYQIIRTTDWSLIDRWGL